MARFTDPVTGDTLTRSERMSWMVQGVIRRWTMLIALTLGTAGLFAFTAVNVGASLHAGDLSLLTWWNLGASWLAIMVEGTVGIAMFSMARRTAQHIRRIESVIERLDHIIEHHPDIPPVPAQDAS